MYEGSALPSMYEKKSPESFEFRECVIGSLHGTHTFLAEEAYSNMRFLDHINVVRSITYG